MPMIEQKVNWTGIATAAAASIARVTAGLEQFAAAMAAAGAQIAATAPAWRRLDAALLTPAQRRRQTRRLNRESIAAQRAAKIRADR